MEGRILEVTIRTPSRLHFGMIDLRGDLGRLYGSVGIAINKPNIVLKASPSHQLKISGPRIDRIKHFTEVILKDSNIKESIDIKVVSDIIEHSGFGSGTQLALAVGTAISNIYSLNYSAEELALKLGRSKRSSLGTYAFKHGGFIVDGGHKKNIRTQIPPLIFRADVPEDWEFVIGLPIISNKISGKNENNKFVKLKSPPSNLVGEISRVILIQMIPAILEKDIYAFGDAITKIDFIFGDFWLDVQGGRFSHPIIEEGIKFLLEIGALGVGQSSWGPVFYGLIEGRKKAEAVSSKLYDFLNKNERQGESFVVQPDNKGAIVTVKE